MSIYRQIKGLLDLTAPYWPHSAGQNGLGVTYDMMKTNTASAPLTQPQKQAKHSCLSPRAQTPDALRWPSLL